MIKFNLLLLITPLLLKCLYVDNFIYHYTATRFWGFGQVLANDAVIYCGLMLLLYLSALAKTNSLLTVIFRLSACAIFSIYIIDYAVIVNFNTHLVVNDVIKYADYSYKYLQQIYGLNGFSILLIAVASLFPMMMFSVSKYKIPHLNYPKLPMLVIAGLPFGSHFADNHKYAHTWIYQNVIDYNLTILSESSAYSNQFVNSFNYQEKSRCQVTQRLQKNIILLMVESFSSYQSEFFSGINNWTPNLDQIARDNLAFKNFYANGFITEDGEIALLTGLQPIYPPSSYTDDGGTSFQSFFNINDSLPNILKKHSYQTEFLTTADLEFGNTGNWAKSIGFDHIEGHDQPDYNKWERFHFQAAPDEALYLRTLSRIKQQRQPFFIFIKTVSSHHPFTNPENNHKSESEAILYTDKQIGQFYRHLQANGFFDNGLLIIVGDHHSMTPLKKAELDQYGQFKAAAKIPLVIAGGGYTGVESRQYQQIDIFNSLQGLVTGKQCYSDWRGILLGESIMPPKYIAHRRGDNRDIISIFTENEDFLVKLDGDNTRFAGSKAKDQAAKQEFIDKINALRLERSKNR